MQRERLAETQAEGEAGSMQGARHGNRSRASRVMPWGDGRHHTSEPPWLLNGNLKNERKENERSLRLVSKEGLMGNAGVRV